MPLLGHAEEARSYRAPVIGDHVISHHQQWAYYAATIVSFDRETLKYTVDWDDGDPTGKVQSYKVCREIRLKPMDIQKKFLTEALTDNC